MRLLLIVGLLLFPVTALAEGIAAEFILEKRLREAEKIKRAIEKATEELLRSGAEWGETEKSLIEAKVRECWRIESDAIHRAGSRTRGEVVALREEALRLRDNDLQKASFLLLFGDADVAERYMDACDMYYP